MMNVTIHSSLVIESAKNIVYRLSLLKEKEFKRYNKPKIIQLEIIKL